MSHSSSPLIDHQIIPIPGRSPVTLFSLQVSPPDPVRVVLAIDMSESCGDLSKVFVYVRKLLGQMPGDWPLQIYRLSDPIPISRSGLTLIDLCESTHWVKDLCFSQNLHHTAARRGRFLRPVVESLAVEYSLLPSLLLVLTDASLADFGNIEIPKSVEIGCILPLINRFDSGQAQATKSRVRFFEMQDSRLDEFISRYTHPFYGPVIVEPRGIDYEGEKFFRVDTEGRLTAWSRMPNHIIHLGKGRQQILFDGSLEQARAIQWKLKSCTTQTVKVLQGSLQKAKSNLRLGQIIVDQFTKVTSGQKNELIVWVTRDDPRIQILAEQFENASALCEQGEAWIDDEGVMKVFEKTEEFGLVTDDGQCRHQAMVAVRVSCPDTGKTQHIGMYALHREHEPAIAFRREVSEHGLIAKESFAIRFDPQLYRWMLSVTTASNGTNLKTIELEYYASEIVDLPLRHDDGDVTTIFSGRLS